VVGELHVDLARPADARRLAGRDDMRVGDDLAVAREHEARADAALLVAAQHRPEAA
jgi:hypothetical protein